MTQGTDRLTEEYLRALAPPGVARRGLDADDLAPGEGGQEASLPESQPELDTTAMKPRKRRSRNSAKADITGGTETAEQASAKPGRKRRKRVSGDGLEADKSAGTSKKKRSKPSDATRKTEPAYRRSTRRKSK